MKTIWWIKWAAFMSGDSYVSRNQALRRWIILLFIVIGMIASILVAVPARASGIHMRYMYDAWGTGIAQVPKNANIIVVDVRYANQIVKRPGVKYLTIDKTGGNHPEADILDFETPWHNLFTNNPAKARQWVIEHYKIKGTPPTIYANPKNYGRLKPYLAGLQWDWWVPNPTGRPHVYNPRPGEKKPVATQYLWKPGGKDYDASVVSDPSWPSKATRGFYPGNTSNPGGTTGWNFPNSNLSPMAGSGNVSAGAESHSFRNEVIVTILLAIAVILGTLWWERHHGNLRTDDRGRMGIPSEKSRASRATDTNAESGINDAA